jgi:hypothetical protein
MNRSSSSWTRVVVTGVLSVGLILLWARQITGSAVEKDSAQSLLMAVNLVHHGVISEDEGPPFAPSNYREPVPVFVEAVSVAVTDAVWGEAASATYLSGTRLRYIKLENLLWLGLLCFGALYAFRVLTGSYVLGWIAVLAIGVSFGRRPEIVNNLYTDLPAAALLMIASAVLARALTVRRASLILLAGALFGVLALIKAAVLYVFAGTWVLLGCWRLAQRVLPIRARARDLALLAAAFLCVVAPWSIRNYLQLGTPQITQRSGVVLMCRAIYDGMTNEEYVGSFYVWAPMRLQRVFGTLLGFSRPDLMRGGRLQHMNRDADSDFAKDDLSAERAGQPDRAISYYRRARAERVRLEEQLAASGAPHPQLQADLELKQHAMQLIMAHPWRHLVMTIPFLWCGAPLAFVVLVAGLVLAIKERRIDLGAFALPAFGIVMFYALLSHFITRYGDPVRPLTIVLTLVVVKLLWDVQARAPAHQPMVAPR